MNANEDDEPDVHTPLMPPILENHSGTFTGEVEGDGSLDYASFDDSSSLKRGHHRRAQGGSIFAFGSTLINELRSEFAEYEEMESIALNALFDIAEQCDIEHQPLDSEELVAATVLIVEEELDYGDLRWSLLSNTFFIFGGLYELISSIWDLEMNGEDNTNEFLSVLRIAVALLGPLVYCLNSIVDVTWALRVEQREDRRQQLDELQIDLVAPDKDAELVEKHDQNGQKEIRLRLPFEPHNIVRRLRKHIGHRRALGAAIGFGFGAFFEFLSAYLDEFSASVGDEGIHLVDALSVNAYMASAMFALIGQEDERKLKPWADVWHDASRLESLGDIFFGVSTVVDCAICYLRLDEWGPYVFIWAVISASLWQFDAIFYLRADVNSMTLYKANRPLGHAAASSPTNTSASSLSHNS